MHSGPARFALGTKAQHHEHDAELQGILDSGRGYSAASAVILRRGVVVAAATSGVTALYADDSGTPASLRKAVTAATLFDIASVTKVFVATAALKLGQSTLDIDEPIGRWLPSFRHGATITTRQLLTHTSGLPAVLPLISLPGQESRLHAVLNAPLHQEPFEYSCIGFIVLGLLLEQITGTTLPSLIHEEIVAPLGLDSTGYLPDQGHDCAATEFQPGRGLVSGSVHDESSWSLGGAAGNAGIFSTAADLARFGEALRTGSLLPPGVVAEMTRNQLPAGVDPGYGHGLGVRLNAMPPLEGFSHTGFTGTSLAVDPGRELVVALLTNRVHPHRDWHDAAEIRLDVSRLASQCA